ncbi:MAG: TIGR02391 family protein [Candidatus Cloacimonetes bacterium]|nr:TIGR02391 family protein [Candidatus Cloacimonadota bacterium]
MKKFPLMQTEVLENIARVLGDSFRGLTDDELTELFQSADIPDIMPLAPRWIRLYNAFSDIQKKTGYSNNIIAFIHKCMRPTRYRDNYSLFLWRRDNLNVKLIFAGLEMTNSGKLKLIKPADHEYIDRAKEMSDQLKKELHNRMAHPEVIKLCQKELLVENYCAVIFEAQKQITHRIRNKTGLTENGIELVREAFAIGNNDKPFLAINDLANDQDYREHSAFVNLLTGVFGIFRNPTLTEPQITWELSLEDTLDLLSMFSYLNRKIDKSRICI